MRLLSPGWGSHPGDVRLRRFYDGHGTPCPYSTLPGFDAAARARLTRALKAEAARLGFDACGVAEATHLDDEARRLEAWLGAGMHAGMGWMEGHFDKRVDPRRLVEGARSVVSVLHNYYADAPPPTATTGRIARYAWGDDYHDVMRARLAELFEWLRAEVGEVGGRAFVDSAPVLDKAWAARSGLGWQGKNSNLIHPRKGSFFFLGELIIDVPLTPDGPLPDYCGTCTRCLDACPTEAIVQPYVVDAQRCISYLTIEHRGAWDEAAPTAAMGTWIYGCDVCQDVCPWNKFSRPTAEPRYAPRPGLPDTDLRDWLELDLEEFRRRFKGSAVKRAKYEGFVRNVHAAARNVAPARCPIRVKHEGSQMMARMRLGRL